MNPNSGKGEIQRHTTLLRHIVPTPLAVVLAIFATLLAYFGGSERPALVADPILASITTGICCFVLLFPFTRRTWSIWDVLSPEIMGGAGFLFYIGIGAVSNHLWPGLAVNPSLFVYLPVGIATQTAAAIAFWFGTLAAHRRGLNGAVREVRLMRLMIVLTIYAAFTLYISALMPRADSQQLRTMIRAGESVSWLLTVGPFIVLQTLPMLIAAQVYLCDTRFVIVRLGIMAIFGFAILLFIVSGSRTYGVQVILLILISASLAYRRFQKKLISAGLVLAAIVFFIATALRIGAGVSVEISLGTVAYSDILDRASLIGPAAEDIGVQGVQRNLQENIVYHLSDNQTMAMLIRNYDNGILFGRATLNTLIGSLPDGLRPAGYRSGTNEIIEHFRFYKEMASDAYYLPDWQMSIGVLGFADFGIVGLLLYPFFLGMALRWVYNRTVLSSGLGQAGWLLYVPLIQMLWNPLLLGPDSLQTVRLLVPLAVALWWASRKTKLVSDQGT